MSIDNYPSPEAKPIRNGYLDKAADYFVIAGCSPQDARAMAEAVLARETRNARKKLTPVEMRDRPKRFLLMACL